MIVYVGAGSGPLRDRVIAAGHGQIVSASHWQRVRGRWVFDNGAFFCWKHGLPFDAHRFVSCLKKIDDLEPAQRPEWCVVPDLVAGGMDSLDVSIAWRNLLPDAFADGGWWRWYLAVQDGMTEDAVAEALEADIYDGIFVGGSTSWKLQRAARWVEFAHDRRLPCHIGRVNGRRRLQWAINIQADSIDGTGWTRAPHWLPYIEDLPKPEPMLPFGEVTR